MSLVNSRTLSTRPRPRPRTIEIVLEDPRGQGHVLEDSITGAQTCHFRNLAFPGLKERFCPWERTFPGRKHSFVHRNANSPTNDQSEFGQDNGRTRNTAAKVEAAHRLLWGRPRVFTIPTALNLHFNSCRQHAFIFVSCWHLCYGTCKYGEVWAWKQFEHGQWTHSNSHVYHQFHFRNTFGKFLTFRDLKKFELMSYSLPFRHITLFPRVVTAISIKSPLKTFPSTVHHITKDDF